MWGIARQDPEVRLLFVFLHIVFFPFVFRIISLCELGELTVVLHNDSSAIEHQAGLAALVEKIENVKTGHEKLERDNNALQEYIGGLTKSMSKTDLTTGRKK